MHMQEMSGHTRRQTCTYQPIATHTEDLCQVLSHSAVPLKTTLRALLGLRNKSGPEAADVPWNGGDMHWAIAHPSGMAQPSPAASQGFMERLLSQHTPLPITPPPPSLEK